MTDFKKEVLNGLGQDPKRLPSKYLYDLKGDKIFQQIMELEEYYLYRSELEIIEQQGSAIASEMDLREKPLHIIELGAGDGVKTSGLLAQWESRFHDLVYSPLDISAQILCENQENTRQKAPHLKVKPRAGNYFETLKNTLLPSIPNRLIMFLGGNVGNYTWDETLKVMHFFRQNMESSNYLLIGFDLKKNPRKILAAYDDSKGVTSAFNLNLLERINRELNANFDLSRFIHYPTYDPISGECRSYLLSTQEQDVRIGSNHSFHFDPHEVIHTEISRKYSIGEIGELAHKNGMKVRKNFYDHERNYVLSLLQLET